MQRDSTPNTNLKRKGNPRPPKKLSQEDAAISRWWTASEKDDVAGSVFAVAKEFSKDQAMRMAALNRWFRLYNNSPARGILPGNYYRSDYGIVRQNRLTLNVCKSCIDTVHGKIAKNRVRALILTNDGMWSEQKKAKLLQKFLDGLFYQTDFYRTAAMVFRDAAIFGTGIIKILEDEENRVSYERGFVDEFFVDEVEAAYTPYPQTLYQQRTVPRDILLSMFVKDKKLDKDAFDKIMEAKTAKLDLSSNRAYAAQADLITVIESWHLPSKKPEDLDRKKLREWRDQDGAASDEMCAYLLENAGDGRKTFTIETGVLDFCGWRRMKHPIETLHWTAPIRGFLNGIGVSEELMGIQYEINKILRKIQDSIDWCVPKMFVQRGSKVALSHLDDVAGGIIEYNGTKPELDALSAVSPELFSQLDRLLAQAYQIVGVSELSAQSKKPAGLESGKALETFNDIESERFIMAGRTYEDFTLGCADQGIELAREIADRDGDYEVQAPVRRRAMERVPWSEVDMKRDAYIMQAYPTSSLPTRPEAKLQMVDDLMRMQFLDREDALRLLDFPDLDAVNELAEASADFTAWQIEKMVEDGEMVQPEPQQNLKYALAKVQAAFLKIQTMDGKHDNAERAMLNFITACVKKLMPPPMPMMPGAPGAPPMMGGGAPALPPGGAMPGGIPGPEAGAAPVAGPAPVPAPPPI